MIEPNAVPLGPRHPRGPLTEPSGRSDPNRGKPVDSDRPLHYLRIEAGPNRDPVVRVCAVAMTGVGASAPLLERLNDINSQLRFARIFWAGEQVLIESELPGIALSFDGIESAYNTVGGATHFFGPLLAEEFGADGCVESDAGIKAAPNCNGYL